MNEWMYCIVCTYDQDREEPKSVRTGNRWGSFGRRLLRSMLWIAWIWSDTNYLCILYHVVVHSLSILVRVHRDLRGLDELCRRQWINFSFLRFLLGIRMRLRKCQVSVGHLIVIDIRSSEGCAWKKNEGNLMGKRWMIKLGLFVWLAGWLIEWVFCTDELLLFRVINFWFSNRLWNLIQRTKFFLKFE